MTIERAIEILDPEHRENYESIDPVNEACRMAIAALREKQEREQNDPSRWRNCGGWTESRYGYNPLAYQNKE